MNRELKTHDNNSGGLVRHDGYMNPFALFDRFFSDSWDPFNTLTPSLFRSRGTLGGSATLFPKVDVRETDSEIVVTANVPGIDPNDVDIEVGDDYISLSGKIEKESKDASDGKVYRYEREYGEFRRDFALPARVDKDAIVAKAKNGVLTVTLPKVDSEKKKKVKVEVE